MLSEGESIRALQDAADRGRPEGRPGGDSGGGIRYGRIQAEPETWQTCCVVGAGHSLKGFDLGRLRGRTVLAVNDAMLNVPGAAAVFSNDHRWVRSRWHKLVEFSGEKFVAIPEHHEDLIHRPFLIYLRRTRDGGLSENPDTVTIGGCSGYAAVNVAVLKGATRIELYGFDLTPGRAWESEHQEDAELYEMWAREFYRMLPILARRGIKVVNMSEHSAIKAFPKESING